MCTVVEELWQSQDGTLIFFCPKYCSKWPFIGHKPKRVGFLWRAVVDATHLDSCLSGVMPARGLKSPCPKIPFFPEVLSQFQKFPFCACYPKGIIEGRHHFVGKGYYVSAGWQPGRNRHMWFKLLPPGIVRRENGQMEVPVGKEVSWGVKLPESLRNLDLSGRMQWYS